MHARPRSEIVSIHEARALLGLAGPVDGAGLTAAFRAAIKSARPDRAGGDETRFRRTIAAWRLLQAEAGKPLALAAPDLHPATLPVISITPLQAVFGGKAIVSIGTRTLRVNVASGARTGDRLRLNGAGLDGESVCLSVLIRAADGLSAMGNDLHMVWPTSPRLIEDGGRVEIETHGGIKSAWITRGLTSPICLRLRDMGLPERDDRPAGHLFVTLVPNGEASTPAEDALSRFTQVWTPERLAA